MQQSNLSKLKAAIAAAIVAVRDLPDREIAAAVIDFQPELIRDWALERISALVRMQRRQRPINLDQMAFPFYDRDLAIQIPTKKGLIEIGAATIGKLREAEKLLIKKRVQAVNNPRPNSLLGRIQIQIPILEPFAYANRRLTVARFVEAQRSGDELPTKPKKQSPGMSEAMLRYWDSKSPEERSAIVRRRRAKAAAKKAGKKKG
ncbi:MAG: hypothetical protein M3N41_10210 [Acidobacteriota bacterium]|nr:hypothetical protein [Acidobacteriota bacterium]